MSNGSKELVGKSAIYIDEGKNVSIVGCSGAGKTTLFQILGTLDLASSGSLSDSISS